MALPLRHITPLLPNVPGVDTGASHTNVCRSVLAKLNLTATASVSVLTPSTGSVPYLTSAYDVEIAIQGVTPTDVHFLPTWQVVESDLTSQGIDGLLGRDILARSRLVYSGPDNMFYLSF